MEAPNMKWNSLFAAIGLILAINPLPALSEILRCDQCLYFNAEERALEAGFGNYTVLNFQDKVMWRFAVVVDPEARRIFGHPLPLMAVDIGVDPADAAAFNEIASVWANNGGSLKLDFEMRPGDPLYPTGTLTGFGARDVTWSAQVRESIGRTIARLDYPGEAGRVVSTLSSVVLSAVKAVAGDAQLRVIVVFPDGSSAIFVISPNHTTQAEYELGSARDSEGNIVPDQSHVAGGPNNLRLLGTLRFDDPNNLANWLERASQLGIPFSDGRAQPNNRPVIVECTWVGGKVFCKARYASV